MIHPFKFNGPTDKLPGAWHQNYPVVMARLLASLKNTEDAILEIGTDGGAPLLAYRAWFNESRIVIGMDINPSPASVQHQKLILHLQCDAYTPSALESLKSQSPFAYLCDDGSHQLGHQLFFAEHYPQLLSEDGIGCIEDIQDPAHIAYLHSKLPPEFTGFTVDLRLADSRYDSLIWLFFRKDSKC